jgi:hypothetical protein
METVVQSFWSISSRLATKQLGRVFGAALNGLTVRANRHAWLRLALACAVWILPMSTRSLGATGVSKADSCFGIPARTCAQPLGGVVLNPAAKSRMDDEAFKAPMMPVPVAALPSLFIPEPISPSVLSFISDEFGPSGRPLLPLRI